MARHRIHLFTFKAGLLSRVAHDLRLRVERVSIRREGDQIRGQFEVDSIQVEGVMSEGRLDTTVLGPRDRAKIAATIQAELLRSDRHPLVRYTGRLDGLSVDGALTLAGVERPLRVAGRRVGDEVHASVELRPSDHGIAPYKALAGAIRLQDRVRVSLELDASSLGVETPPGP